MGLILILAWTFNTSELDELFQILNSIKGFKLRQPQWSNTTLFIDTALDKTHYRLKDATGLLLDRTYHVNHIKKGLAYTPKGIVSTFDGYEKALKNTLLNKFAIKTPDNKIQEVTLEDGLKELNYLPGSIMDYASIYG